MRKKWRVPANKNQVMKNDADRLEGTHNGK